jgi:hypothetical protein
MLQRNLTRSTPSHFDYTKTLGIRKTGNWGKEMHITEEMDRLGHFGAMV